jgi:hypothetical protein
MTIREAAAVVAKLLADDDVDSGNTDSWERAGRRRLASGGHGKSAQVNRGPFRFPESGHRKCGMDGFM